MKKYFVIFAAGIITLSLCYCGSSKGNNSEQKNTSQQVSVSDSNLYAWVNLMPGSKAKFHVTGDLQINNAKKPSKDSVLIKSVKVSQSGQVFYIFSPVTELIGSKENESSLIKNVHFTDGKGYQIDSAFNSELPVKLEFHILTGDEDFIYNTKDIKVEKIY